MFAKRVSKLVLGVIVGLFLFGSSLAFAQDPAATLLPETSIKLTSECQVVMDYVGEHREDVKFYIFDERGTLDSIPGAVGVTNVGVSDILGCGIKTGSMKLWMAPYYIRYFLEFIIGLAGLIAVGGLVYGGYLYLFGPLGDDKDKGKKAIMYGVGGFILTLVAFALVNVVISLVSG